MAASAKPDGYTLLSHNNGLAGYAAVDKLFGRQPKTTRADFIPLARLSADPVLLLVNEQQPWKTLEEFIADAKARPEQIVYSSGGLYGASHLPVAMIEKAAGLPRMRHLPTSGGGPAITAVLGNNAQMTTQTGQATYQHIKAGKMRALASFGEQRSKTLPDVPTLKERVSISSTISGSGCSPPRARPRRSSRRLRRPSTRPAQARNSLPRSPISDWSRPTFRPRILPSSGTRTRSAPTRPYSQIGKVQG